MIITIHRPGSIVAETYTVSRVDFHLHEEDKVSVTAENLLDLGEGLRISGQGMDKNDLVVRPHSSNTIQLAVIHA